MAAVVIKFLLPALVSIPLRTCLLYTSLIEEGAAIHYEESTELVTDAFRDPATPLVVYTPAVPDTHKELSLIHIL